MDRQTEVKQYTLSPSRERGGGIKINKGNITSRKCKIRIP
jgi:hypothetical protein